jgi:hypothetical protein
MLAMPIISPTQMALRTPKDSAEVLLNATGIDPSRVYAVQPHTLMIKVCIGERTTTLNNFIDVRPCTLRF